MMQYFETDGGFFVIKKAAVFGLFVFFQSIDLYNIYKRYIFLLFTFKHPHDIIKYVFFVLFVDSKSFGGL